MEIMKTECNKCGQHIEYTGEHAGGKTECPSCQAKITLPPKKIGGGRGTEILVGMIGIGLLVVGFGNAESASTIMQQIYGAIEFCSGFIVIAIALAISVLTTIVKNQSRE
jgi:NAD-dependent SIR2 family protein deacetylase